MVKWLTSSLMVYKKAHMQTKWKFPSTRENGFFFFCFFASCFWYSMFFNYNLSFFYVLHIRELYSYPSHQ